MHHRKYSKITLERNEIPIKNTRHKLPHLNPKTLSLGNPPKSSQLPIILPPSLPRNTLSRLASATNIKSRKQTLSVKNSYKNKVGGFDNQIILEQRSKSVKKNYQAPGLSREAMIQRRQSHLNTYFNIRKNKLQEITKENKRIYVRINSQKSMYSSRLNHSTDSVSNSRLSHNSSRHSIDSLRKSIKSKLNLKKAVAHKQEPTIKIESRDINKLQNTQVTTYLNIFCNHFSTNVKTNKKEIIRPHHTQKGKENNDYSDGLGKILEQVEQKRETKQRQVFGRLI